VKIFVSEDYGKVEGVWVKEVPEDFSDADVAYSVELLAEKGDRVAQKALPFIRVSLGRPERGTRVYKDD